MGFFDEPHQQPGAQHQLEVVKQSKTGRTVRRLWLDADPLTHIERLSRDPWWVAQEVCGWTAMSALVTHAIKALFWLFDAHILSFTVAAAIGGTGLILLTVYLFSLAQTAWALLGYRLLCLLLGVFLVWFKGAT